MKRFRKGSDVIFKVLGRNKFHIFLIVCIVALIVTFANIIIPSLVILALAAIGSFSTSYKRIIRVPPAFELVTFTTIMVSLAYGPIVGVIFAAVVTLASEIMTNALDLFVVSFIPSRMVIAFTAGYMFDIFNHNIFLTGFVSTILYNILAQPLYLLIADAEMKIKSAYFTFINIGSNFVIFTVFGNLFASLLGII